MIDPTVRPATPADAGPLQVLEAEARAAVGSMRGGARWLDEHPEVGDRWAEVVDGGGVLVAELNAAAATGAAGFVVGYLVLQRNGGVALVDQVYITPEARQLGFGDALLEAALALATTGGATFLEGYALPGDRETKNLYERAGITARLITVSRPLR